MIARSFILRCTAFLLLLVFSQKAGTGLLLHNLLHAGKETGNHPVKQNDKTKELRYACNCIDDFLMPFAPADEPVIEPVVTARAVLAAYTAANIPFITPAHCSLRGPPFFA